MSRAKGQKDGTIFWMRMLFVFLILGGGFCSWYFHAELVHLLAHALIIAGILGLTVDYYVKRHLVREAARDIDKYLLGYALPSELQEKIREVRDAKVVRRRFKCEYTISPIDGEKIKLEADLTFEVENMTNRRQDYTAELVLDKHNSPEIILMSCRSYRDWPQEYALAGSALRVRTTAATIEVSAKKLRLQPKTSFYYVNYEFRHRYSQILPANGSEYFQFDQPYPTIGVHIIVNHPKEFSIHFPSGQGKVEPGRAEWRDDEKIFLRGEIITIWWTAQRIHSPDESL